HQLVQFGHLVHRENATVHTRDQTEVERLLGRHTRAGRELGRVDLADNVGELGARRQPLGVALLPRPPGDRDALFGRLRDELLTRRGDRAVRVFVDRNAGVIDVGDELVKEADERAHQPALGLPLLAEKEHVVPGNEGEVDLRDYRIFVTDD